MHPLSSAFVLPPQGTMSCHSYHAGSGSSPRNYSSCSEVLPPKGAQCHASNHLCPPIDIGICYRGPGDFSSRSISSYGLRLATSSSVPGRGPQSGVGVTSGYCGPGYNYSFIKAGGIIKAPSASGIAPVTCNESLLQPLQLGIDSMALSVKHQAKNELQSLNSRLASFIDKVRLLEQHNLMLKTKWDFVREKKRHKSNMEPFINEHIKSLKKELECVENEKAELRAEHKTLQQAMESNKRRFEEECDRRISTENEFILLKKVSTFNTLPQILGLTSCLACPSRHDVIQDALVFFFLQDLDCAFAHKAELEAKTDSHLRQISFLRCFYKKSYDVQCVLDNIVSSLRIGWVEWPFGSQCSTMPNDVAACGVIPQEIDELQNRISNTCVMVQMDNSRDLDMDQAVEEFRRQYEGIASRSRAEAEAWFQGQYQSLRTTAAKNCDDLRNVKEELQALTRVAHTLESEIASTNAQRCKLEEEVAGAEERGEIMVKDAKRKLTGLEEALHKAKQDMACQLRQYHELMNVKLALDIEIVTYRKLLEGEECREVREQSCVMVAPVMDLHALLQVEAPTEVEVLAAPLGPLVAAAPLQGAVRQAAEMLVALLTQTHRPLIMVSV
ncbi:hypothetical protein lerEdw1_001605, partial [Lerista edwardsae]